MKKIVLIFLLILTSLMFSNFYDDLKNYVENSPEYLEALKNYMNVEFEDEFRLNFGTNINKSSLNYDFEKIMLNVPISFNYSDDFELYLAPNINGSSVTLPLGVNFSLFNFDLNLEGNFSFVNDDFRDSYSFSISKNLFDNSDESDLEKEINKLNAKRNLLNVKNQKVIEFLNNVFYSNFYSKMYDVYSKLLVLKEEELKESEEKFEKGIISEIEYLNSKKSYIAVQKNYLTYRNKKREYEKYTKYNFQKFDVEIPEKSFNKRDDLKALQLEVELNKLRMDRIYQLYIPNMTFGFEVDYNYKPLSSEKELKPKLFLNFTFDLSNQKALEEENRRLNYEISIKNLETKIEDLEDQYESLLTELESLNYDYEISKINKRIKEINYLNLKQKLEDGLITKNEYESAMYELLVEEYNLENVEFSILIQKLNIYSFLGYDLLSLLEEVL
ncbi:MAG: TolC family protein [Thermosipho sp. (in: Bacteria)]|nr:TolC family protein [Thermosipho sp. (in: thermotogales)]